jgi:hypothetical protein
MKTRRFLIITLAFAAFCVMGCSTTPKLVPSSFSFAGSDNENGTAKITFVNPEKVGVRLVDCEGVTIPGPAEGTYWDSAIIFPAERSLDLRVYVYWKEDRYGERRRGIFKCPPLEANREYKLWFKGKFKGGSLILTYANVGNLDSRSEIVHEQVIPPLPR